MSQIYKSASSTPGTVVLTMSAEGGAKFPPDATGNFDFSGGGPPGGIPFVKTDTVTFGINANGLMQANAVFPNWQVIAVSQTAAKSQGYLVLSNAVITLTLPSMPNVGDSFKVAEVGGGTFVIAQNPGDTIQLGNDTTTVSVGSITSTKKGDTLTLVCWASGPGASWIVLEPIGSFVVV